MLHYDRLGHGPNVLLAFHGAGQTGSVCFAPFGAHLGDFYTVYAFDLFYHGQSKGLHGREDFAEDDSLTKALWKSFIHDFLVKNRIARFDVAGFSLGGRYALATAEAFPERLDHLFLIAPDGVTEHPLYTLATRFAPARWAFRQLVRNPKPLFAVTELAGRLRIIPKNLVFFVRYMMDTPAERQRLYRTWVSLRELSFSILSLFDLLKKNRVKVWLFAGKHDTVFPQHRLRTLSRSLPAGRFVVLESSHTRLVERVAGNLSLLLKKPENSGGG